MSKKKGSLLTSEGIVMNIVQIFIKECLKSIYMKEFVILQFVPVKF